MVGGKGTLKAVGGLLEMVEAGTGVVDQHIDPIIAAIDFRCELSNSCQV